MNSNKIDYLQNMSNKNVYGLQKYYEKDILEV